jgi:hypothetical protein
VTPPFVVDWHILTALLSGVLAGGSLAAVLRIQAGIPLSLYAGAIIAGSSLRLHKLMRKCADIATGAAS